MPRDPLNRAFAPTTPDDLNDPPRFSQVLETTKDVLVVELRHFIANAQQTAARRTELPTVEKYATFADGNDPFSSAATIVRQYPGRLEKLPHIAVMTASGQERRLTVGPPFVTTVQQPSRIVSLPAEPYALVDGDSLVLRTLPDARTEYLDTVVFTADRFPTAHGIGAALAVDVARVINEQAAHVHATVLTTGGLNYVQIEAGGPLSNELGRTPTEIEVMSGSRHADVILGVSRSGTVAAIVSAYPSTTLTAPAGAWSSADVGRYVTLANAARPYFNNGRFLVTAFSTSGGTDTLTVANRNGRDESTGLETWFIGARDDHRNPARPPLHRYAMAFDFNVRIDVLTSDENTRDEVVDLVVAFFGFFLEQKFFTFMGRSGFQGQTATGEYYQVVINPPLRNTASNEFQRPGDGTGKVYVNGLSIDVTTSMYLDREVFFHGTNTPFIVDRSNLVQDDTLPLPANS